MQTSPQILVVVNPAAGGGRAARTWDRICDDRESRFREVRAQTPEQTGDALAQAAEDGIERVLVVGGDGSVHVAINEILRRDLGDLLAVGVVPAGTGSDLARCLRLPRNPRKALVHALDRPPRAIDALEIRRDDGVVRRVINTASVGLSGAVSIEVNRVKGRGQWTYLLCTLQGLLRYRPQPARIVVDGEEIWNDSFFLVAITNGQYFGKGMRVSPLAQLDDGFADVVAIPEVPLWQLPWRLPQFLTGRHLSIERVVHRRAREVRIEPSLSFQEFGPPFELDGETLDAGPATIRVLPGALRILA